MLQAPKKEKGPAPRPPSIVSPPSTPEREKGRAPPPPVVNNVPAVQPSESMDTSPVPSPPVSVKPTLAQPETVKNPAPKPPKPAAATPPSPKIKNGSVNNLAVGKAEKDKKYTHADVATQEDSKKIVDLVCDEAEKVVSERKEPKSDSNHFKTPNVISDNLIKYSSVENVSKETPNSKYSSVENINKEMSSLADKKMNYRKSSADMIINNRNSSTNSSSSSNSSNRGLTRVNSQVVVEIRDEVTGQIIPIRSSSKPPAPKIIPPKAVQAQEVKVYFHIITLTVLFLDIVVIFMIYEGYSESEYTKNNVFIINYNNLLNLLDSKLFISVKHALVSSLRFIRIDSRFFV